MASATKAELRNAVLRRRDAVGPAARDDLATRLVQLGPGLVADFVSAGTPPVVSLFAPIGSEPDAMPLASALHAAGIPLTLPVDRSPGTPLVYRRWAPGDPLALGPLGIAEPLEDAPEEEPDVLFVPVIAFDRSGTRLGYGAGNVDRTLSRLRSRKPVLVIGTAFTAQEEPNLPRGEHDEPLDLVVTETDVLLF